MTFSGYLLFRDGLQGGGCSIDGAGEDGHLGLGAWQVLRVDGLVDARNDDGSVSGVFAGCVDGVFEPGAIGETRLREKAFFDVAELRVEGDQGLG